MAEPPARPYLLPALVHQDGGGDVIRWEQRQSVIARQPTSLNSLSGMQKIAIGAGIGAGMMFWLSKGLAPDTGFPWRETTTGAAIGAAIVYNLLR